MADDRQTVFVSCLDNSFLQLKRSNRDGVGRERKRAAVLLHKLDIVGAVLLVAHYELVRGLRCQLGPKIDFGPQLEAGDQYGCHKGRSQAHTSSDG